MQRKTEAIRGAILRSIFENNGLVDAAEIAASLNVTPKTIYTNLRALKEKGQIQVILKEGRKNIFKLCPLVNVEKEYATSGLQEDIVLTRDFLPLLGQIPEIPRGTFSYVFTEMLNNAIEHSESPKVSICAWKTAYSLSCSIMDYGVGIFAKIQESMGLAEKRFAILELAKGKFTTDPSSHTGEGVFFSSKMADHFMIFSDQLAFVGASHENEAELLLDIPFPSNSGTVVLFDVALNRQTKSADIMNRYTAYPDDYGFSKTVVPVRLLEYRESNPQFLSRSQARRLYARFEKFENIVLDFSGISEIGQSFADELFRVFPSMHPESTITYTNATPAIERMLKHVLSNR